MKRKKEATRMAQRILIVDDEASICWSLSQALEDEGYSCQQASSAEDALRIASEFEPDAILLDVRLPGMSGLEALDALQETSPHCIIVVMTAFGDLQTAVAAIRSSAFEYLTKPFELEHAIDVVRRGLRTQNQEGERTQAGMQLDPPQGMVGTSPAMQRVFKQVAQAANCDVPVLVTGESGTGKELIAEAIHQHSPRGEQSFMPVCLAAMNENLVESELFGHVRGAFTGAEGDRRGVLELARHGTVFLDEIGDVPLAVQVKLLRAIERQEWIAVGASRPIQGDFRVVAATHQPLLELIRNGEFREDLYYRLAVFHIELPPLRERLEDLELLVDHFLRLIAGGEPPKRMSPQALSELRSRVWYGNVRELKNVVEHAAIVARSHEIGVEHLPKPIELGVAEVEVMPSVCSSVEEWTKAQLLEESPEDLYDRLLAVVEPPLLQEVLESVGGNRVAASSRLGMHRATLRQKLRRHGLDESSSED
jgi:DNA-binding NtrC family response regulator